MVKTQGRLRNDGKIDNAFNAFNYIGMVFILVITLYPFVNLLSMSFSGAGSGYGLGIIPKNISFYAYETVLTNNLIWIGYKNTIIRVLVGTGFSLVITTMGAYAWSKKTLPFRKLFTFIIIFTMFFNGGLIPNYFLIKSMHLMDSIWSLILPRLVDTFALIVMRNFFLTIPESLEESAKMDGANYYTILYKIVIPISLPIIATVILWNAVWHWNAWFDSMIYIQSPNKKVLQMILRNIVMEGTQQVITSINSDQPGNSSNPDVIKAAAVVFATVPIVCVYPFVQKYFVTGVIVGSVKG